MNLSVIIITKNAATHLRSCLESVQWANEIIILDSGSTDDTLLISRAYTPHVKTTVDWPGFGPQKNRALHYATQDWVLSIDADEIVTPDLQHAIQHAIQYPTANGYYLERHSFFCGQRIRFGDWGHDEVLRLFKRGSGYFDDAIVHECLHVKGACKKLKGALLHYTADSLEKAIDKMLWYARLGAQKKMHQGKSSSVTTALLHSVFAFFRGYFLKLGLLDGRAGLVLAILIAEGTYYRYLYMVYRQHYK